MSQSTNLVFNGGNIPAARGQSDWAETNPQAESYIKNKPNIDDGRFHRLRSVTDEVIGETSEHGEWVLDLESPNDSAPGGYDRLTPQRLNEILNEGALLAIETFPGSDYVPLALQALVQVTNRDPLRISVDFVRQYASGNILGFERVKIYTPAGAESYLQMLDVGPQNRQDKEALAINGDGKDVTVTFNEASTVANIASGEELSIILGKIAKWFSSGFPMRNYGRVTITSPTIVVNNNGYTLIVNPSGSQEGSVRVQINSAIGEFPNVELDIDNLNGNMPLSVTVRTFDGYTYSDLPPMLEGTSTVPVGGIFHVSAHGLGWFGTTLDTST